MLSKIYKKLPLIIWLLLAFFLVRGFIYASFVPAWQGPDEPLHYDYVHYLQTEKTLPVLGETTMCRKVRFSLQSFYFSQFARDKSPYASKEKLATKEEKVKKIEHTDILPSKTKKSGASQRNQIVQHPPLYYILGAIITWPFKDSSLLTNIYILRIFGLLLGLGVILLTYFTVSLIFEKNRYPAYGAAAFVALNPMFTHITTRVNNDSLTNFFFALFIFLLVKGVTQGIDRKNAFAIGAVLGAGLLTKFFFVLAFLVIFIALIIFRKKMVTNISNPLIVLTMPVVISGLYFLRNMHLYGTVQPIYTFRSFNASIFENMGFAKFLTNTNFVEKLFISFWSNFGWIKPRFSGFYHKVLIIVVLLTLLGLVVYLIQVVRKKDFFRFKLVSLLATAPGILILAIAVNSHRGAKTTGVVEGVQGRYLFSFIGVIGLLVFIGLRQLLPIKRDYLTFAIMIVGFLLLDISAIFGHILPYFYF